MTWCALETNYENGYQPKEADTLGSWVKRIAIWVARAAIVGVLSVVLLLVLLWRLPEGPVAIFIYRNPIGFHQTSDGKGHCVT